MFNGWSDIVSTDSVDHAIANCKHVQKYRDLGQVIYPPQDKIFRALQLVSPEEVKVVIVGQDPYHGAGEANGLAFSVDDGVKIPPSLKNIYRELARDLGYAEPTTGDLTPWAEQGVLLLNSVLTVWDGKAGSHTGLGWQDFTGEILKACVAMDRPIVFMLWGRYAIDLVSGYEQGSRDKLFLRSSHPSPLGAWKSCGSYPAFMESSPFSKCNTWLTLQGQEAINWQLT